MGEGWLVRLRDWGAAGPRAPLEVVAGLAQGLVRAGEAPAELAHALGAARPPPVDCLPPVAAGPGVLGQAYEAALHHDDRRARGAFFTPPDLAARLVDLALGPGHGLPAGPVVDPAAGGGAFLLAAADALVGRGDTVAAALGRLRGADVDPAAVAVADASLRWWAAARDGSWPTAPLGVVLADALVDDDAWPTAPAVVVGNPPFLNQLGRATARRRDQAAALARRHGRAARGYVDTAAVFLVAAVRACRAGGRVVLVQPESVLATGHAGPARAELASAAALEGVWLGGAGLFPAAVRVCAPVLVVGADQPPSVRTWSGPGLTPGPPVAAAAVAGRATWSAVTAALRGVPACRPSTSGRVADLATATAGFRDEYYGLAPHVREAAGAPAGWPKLVTVGLVDPVTTRWGESPTRFAGARWQAPVVDLEGLGADRPRLARWVRDRLAPKLVVATQSSVLEAAVDTVGDWVPSVPCVAVEAAPEHLWHLAAVLNSAVASAWALERFAGAGLSPGAVKLSARQVLDIPLPADRSAWDEAALILARAPASIGSLIASNETMLRAYGLVGESVLLTWWASRLPPRLRAAARQILHADA